MILPCHYGVEVGVAVGVTVGVVALAVAVLVEKLPPKPMLQTPISPCRTHFERSSLLKFDMSEVRSDSVSASRTSVLPLFPLLNSRMALPSLSQLAKAGEFDVIIGIVQCDVKRFHELIQVIGLGKSAQHDQVLR